MKKRVLLAVAAALCLLAGCKKSEPAEYEKGMENLEKQKYEQAVQNFEEAIQKGEESILSCMDMILITFTLQNSRNIANSRTPRKALLNFEMTSSSPRSRQSMSCFHSGRVFS